MINQSLYQIINLIKKNQNLFFSLVILLAFFLRTKDLENGYWYDEWSSFFYSNPDYSLVNLYNTVVEKEGSQPFYFVLLRLWNDIFGYTPESARFFSVFFGISSIFLFYFLVSAIKKKSFIFKILSIFLFSTNFFLIE